MRTVSLQSLVDGALALTGDDITQTVQGHTQAAVIEYLNMRLREIQEPYPWPEFMLVEQREYRATFDAGTGYLTDDEVFYDGKYYRALGATTGNLPTDGTYWEEEPADFIRSIDLEQSGQTAIGEVVAVWGSDPRVRRGREYDFQLMGDAVIVPQGPAQPWVEFSVRAVTYTTGDLATGTFPWTFAQFCKVGAAADLLRSDGQYEKAGALEAKAQRIFDAELDKLILKQGAQSRWRVLG